MKKRYFIFLVLAIATPLLLDIFVFGNSIPSNITNEAWASFLGSYIGGLCTVVSVFITVKYYKDSDNRKEKAAIQPFLHVTIGENNSELKKGFSLPGTTKKKGEELKKVNILIKNIGNGFATTLVIHTGANLGGLSFRKVIPVGESVYTFLMVDTDKLEEGLHFGFNFVDAMRNEYIQEYDLKKDGSQMIIECDYPKFMNERK
ncbi:MAG: hypothetical protein ACI32B_05180 [Erysipelotrichaceae bacterium]